MENQMGLFEIAKTEKPVPEKKATKGVKAGTAKKAIQKAVAPVVKGQAQQIFRQKARGIKIAPAKVSGLVPEGDVRLTANIRQDLHLKLKIAAAHKRTTIGEMIEDLIERYVEQK